MTTTENAVLTRAVQDLLAEAYEGAQGPATWFVNNEPNCGVLGSVESLTAAQASRPAVPDGCSIAAHVEHLRWSLANVNAVARGEPWNPDWSESWRVQKVTDSEWDQLRADLRREYEMVRSALDSISEFSDADMLRGVLSLAPHAAHHLGTIRQMAKLVRE